VRRAAALGLAVLTLAACSHSSPKRVAVATTSSTSTTSTTLTGVTTTTGGPAPIVSTPPTTSVALPAARVIVSKTGVVLPVTRATATGWEVTTPCSNVALMTDGKPLTSATVVLDPGHGGKEPGAVGKGGLAEKVVNLAVVRQAQAALEKAGVAVVLTRTGDYDVTLDTRAQVALALKPRAFVSIHHNAEPDGPFPRPGSETYYQVASPDSKRLAGLLYEEVVKALSQYQVAWVADTDAGAKYRKGSSGDDYYGVLRKSHGVVGVLGELAYITDPAEEALLARPDVQAVEGQAVATAILRYLTTKDPGSGFTTPYPRTEPAGGGGTKLNCVDPPL
jgi:N-acetylmuramoyl-L-alanine amidase